MLTEVIPAARTRTAADGLVPLERFSERGGREQCEQSDADIRQSAATISRYGRASFETPPIGGGPGHSFDELPAQCSYNGVG
jgi:hypothetical protein